MGVLFGDPNSKISPQLLTAIGTGLLSGNTWNEQLANAGLGANTAVATQQQKQLESQQRNQTVAMLQQKDPELASMVAAGTLPAKDAYVMYIKKQQDAAAAAKPSFQVLPDGTYGFVHPDTQKFDSIGNAAKPDIPAAAKESKYWMLHPDEYTAYQQQQMNSPKDVPASVQEYIWAKNNQGFAGTLEDYQKNKISLKNQKGTEGNLKGDLETMKAYRGEDPVKTYQVVHAAYQKARSAADLGTAAGDMSLIYAFMKMNDPTSVVREGEFATAANAGGVDDKIINIYNRVRDGQMLTPEQRAQFLQAADAQYQDVSKNVQDVNSRYTPFAKDYNVNTDRFMIQPEKFQPLETGQKQEVVLPSGKKATITKESD